MPTVTDFPILVRNQRFARVLAVSHYRLRDQDTNLHPDQMGNLSSSSSHIRPRMDGYYFSGSPSLAVLQFLEQLVTVAYLNLLTDATLLWIVADFLRPPAQDAFRRQKLRGWQAVSSSS